MKNTFRWIPTITRRNTVVGLAALAIATGITGGLASAAVASPATTPIAATTTTAPAAAKTTAAKTAAKAPASKTLKHSFQLQSNGYFCGPSATRVALSAHGKVYTQDKVAHLLGTTESGTNSAVDVTRVLNKELGSKRYHTVEIGAKATTKDVNRLKTDVVTSINQGDPIVANIAGTITDTAGDTHSYEGGHYLPIIGYTNHGNTVKIADSADTVGSPYYSVDAKTMANWIATRGYAA